MRMLKLDLNQALKIVVKIIGVLIFPYSIFRMNWNYRFSSILYEFSMNLKENEYIFQLFPDIEILIPASLILVPCILWGYYERKLLETKFLISIGFIVLSLIAIMLIFLPFWALFPIPGYVVAAVIPQFIELIPFTSLVFVLFVYVPSIIHIVNMNGSNVNSIRQKSVSLLLTTIAIFPPIIIELWMWESSDWQHHFGESIELLSLTWTMNYNIEGNLWGQNETLFFSIIPLPEIMLWSLINYPGFLFARYMLQAIRGEKVGKRLITTGSIQIIILTVISFWIDLVTTHAGTWMHIPCPCLILTGLVVIIIHYILSKHPNSIYYQQPIDASIQVIES